MITNERQYKITRTQLRGFETALTAAVADGPGIDVDPRIHQAMIAGLGGQIDDLKEQLQRYETLKSGRKAHVSLTSILDLLPTLIEARIAAGLTQRSLSERLGVAEQQVQKWESTIYAGVSVERVQNVADAIGLTIREDVTYGRAD